ncbi:MAG: hypothetical protein Q4C95_07065 [Planctomycetia bacterium]|nr:hypothetical protein [Planctomycetia bacterium]
MIPTPEIDYPLLQRCLNREKYAWEDFIDRFIGLVLHVIDQTIELRNIRLTTDEKCDLCEAVFRSFHYNDFQLLRDFQFHASLSTFLTVLTRRLVVAFLLCE